jgi:hypothetical protein
LIKHSAAQELGLFGELAVIYSSSNKEQMIDNWHSSPYATYDFSNGVNRLEVKTSKSPQRIHWLRNSQSGLHSDSELTYASVYCPETSEGETIPGIVNLIKDGLKPDSINLFERKLSPFKYAKFETKFDLVTAVEKIKFVDSSNVPRPLVTDNSIIDVQWKIDFSRIEVSNGNFIL